MRLRHLLSSASVRRPRRSPWKLYSFIVLFLLGCGLSWALISGWVTSAQAQDSTPAPVSPAPTSRQWALPDSAATKAVVAAGTPGQYVLEFNRSPIVGNRFRLEGIYDEARLRFTRPHDWKLKSVKVLLRYRHSGALYATRSNLTVLLNGTSIGSIPLNKPQGQIGDVVFQVPAELLQDYNEMVVAALQNNSPTCTQDPYDPSLWTEILPDSKLVFDYQPQAVALNFNRYPYPLFDTLSLDANHIAHLQPDQVDETWLTASSRLQTALGRLAEFRSLDTRLVKSIEDVKDGEKLVIIGTPANQSALANLKLPLALEGDRFLDAKKKPLSADVGILMLSTAQDGKVPVLVATGNGPEGVAKAAQFLTQSQDRQIGTGQVILVDQVAPASTPPLRQWQGYLPVQDAFQLKDLRTYDNQPYGDVTVRGSHSPALEFDFKALPDDNFLPGNYMTLRYSYGPQVNPLTSLVEVQLDGVAIDGARLTSVSGGRHESLKLELPQDRIKPNSRIQVNFRLDPRERRSCSRVTDQQLWGTIHADTSFDLQREVVSKLPDLRLLQNAYPFAAPQDMSSMAIVLPEQPHTADLNLLLETATRLGRLTRAESVKYSVYRGSKLSAEQRSQVHLIGIGVQAQFPLKEAFQTASGFTLQQAAVREWQQSRVQAAPDAEGVVKQVISPWNRDRVLLALSAQTPDGLDQVRDLIKQDPLFFQMHGDTVLISANRDNPSPYDTNDYNLSFLQQSKPQTIKTPDPSSQLILNLQRNWYVLAPAIVLAALLLYGVLQLFLKRLAPTSDEG